MADTAIEWTDATWNPVAGCSIMSAGCTNCYAMRMAARLEAMDVEKYKGLTRKSGGRAKWTGEIRLDYGALSVPERWSRPRNIFVNSMSDLFHPDVPESFIAQIWEIIAKTPRHTYQILTKRPERMRAVLGRDLPVLPNVWIGTSVESGEVVNRIDELRKIEAAVKFVSFEPLIGSVVAGSLKDIQWAIVGGESGPNARYIDPKWVDEIFDMCIASDTAFFFKQWGGTRKKASGRTYRDRIWDDLPALSI